MGKVGAGARFYSTLPGDDSAVCNAASAAPLTATIFSHEFTY